MAFADSLRLRLRVVLVTSLKKPSSVTSLKKIGSGGRFPVFYSTSLLSGLRISTVIGLRRVSMFQLYHTGRPM